MKKFVLIGLSILLLLVTAVVLGQSGGGFDLSWSTIDGGGGTSSGGGFALSGTIGQPDAGALSGGDFTLNGGFWQCVTAAVVSPSITTNSTDIDLSWTSSDPLANIYRAGNDPYFTPGATPHASGVSSIWTDPGAAGSVTINYTYIIRAAGSCGEAADSRRLGEFDFELIPGN